MRRHEVIVTTLTVALSIITSVGCLKGDSATNAETVSTTDARRFVESTRTGTATTPKLARTIVFDNQPRQVPAATPAALTGTPFEFGPWDTSTTLIYDVVSGETINLGHVKGGHVSFSEGSDRVAWISGEQNERGEVWVMHLATRTRTKVTGAPDAVSASFNSDDTIRLSAAQQTPDSFVNLAGTAVTAPSTPTPAPTWFRMPHSDPMSAPPGYRLSRLEHLAPGSYDSPTYRFILTTDDGQPSFEFDAHGASPLGAGLIIASSPTIATPGPALAAATLNLYLMDLPSEAVQFLATVPFDHVVAFTDGYIMWSEFACSFPKRPGATYMLDSSSGALHRLELSLAGDIRPDGSFFGLVRGQDFGDSRMILFDVATLQQRAVWDYVDWMQWSHDGRYASPYLSQHDGPFCGI